MPTRYCEIGEVGTLGINAEAIASIEPAAISTQIAATADLMDSALGDRFVLPLTAWDMAVKQCCAVLAGAALLRTRGYNPESDPSVKETVDYWTEWLDLVAKGERRPTVTDSGTKPAPDGEYGAGGFVTSRGRGLSVRGTGRCRLPFQGD